MNWIQIAGHLGSDPEVRHTSSGQKVISFRVAVNTRKGGQDVTVWYRITIWGDRFDRMLPYLKKGSGVIIAGTLQPPEIYTSRDGQTRVSLDLTAEMIQFSPFGRGDRQQQGEAAQPTQAEPAAMAGAGFGAQPQPAAPSSDDDLPF